MASIRSYEITGIEWQRPPTQVAVGEQFDLVVRVLGSAAEETEGQPITFYVDGEELFTTSGADIPTGQTGLYYIQDEGTVTFRVS